MKSKWRKSAERLNEKSLVGATQRFIHECVPFIFPIHRVRAHIHSPSQLLLLLLASAGGASPNIPFIPLLLLCSSSSRRPPLFIAGAAAAHFDLPAAA